MPSRSLPLPVRRARRDFSSHVQTWRKLRGLTQNQLADRAGLDRKTVLRIEQGHEGVSFDSILRVLHALGVLGELPRAIDPYETEIGRLRADETLPQRVRPRDLR